MSFRLTQTIVNEEMSKNYSIQQKSTASKIATMDRPNKCQPEISSLDNDTKFLGLWGKITYYDIFQKSFTIRLA